MQLGGIAGDHSAAMHQVTNCAHDHSYAHKEGGGGPAASDMAAQFQQAEAQQEAQFSLSAWVEKTLGSGKRLLRNLWGSSDGAASGEAGDKSGIPQVTAQVHGSSGTAGNSSANLAGQDSRRQDMSPTLHTPQIAAAATAVSDPQTLHNNPYFAAVEDTGRQQETLWQKVRVRFKDMAGQLAGHLPGNFFNFQAKNSFQARQEQTKEDLRKKSKFRKDEVEIDCVLTDDSYLLDSYDRKGEYSRLSTKK